MEKTTEQIERFEKFSKMCDSDETYVRWMIDLQSISAFDDYNSFDNAINTLHERAHQEEINHPFACYVAGKTYSSNLIRFLQCKRFLIGMSEEIEVYLNKYKTNKNDERIKY